MPIPAWQAALIFANIAPRALGFLGRLRGEEQRTPEQYLEWLGRDPAAAAAMEAQGLPQLAVGREAIGTPLERAGAEQMEAVRAGINRQLAEQIRREELRYGALGTYSSGALEARRKELGAAAQRDIAQALAGVGLQQYGLGIQERELGLREAQLRQQAELASTQIWAGIAEAAAPVVFEKLLPAIMSWFGGRGGAPTTSPGLTSTWEELRF